MSSSKRRKLNNSPTKAPLSAFAARRALSSKAADSPHPDAINEILVKGAGSQKPPLPIPGLTGCEAIVTAEDPFTQGGESGGYGNEEVTDQDTQTSSLQSRAEAPEVLLEPQSITLSSFKPSKDNVKELSNGSLLLKLAPGERLVALGQYGISIRRGQITLMGFTLFPSKAKHRVYASASHALPVIRCPATEINTAEIQLHQCESGLEKLNSLSPLFGKLWNDQSEPLGSAYDGILSRHTQSTFQLLLSSKDGPQKILLQPLISPPEWNSMLARCSSSANIERRIMLCGPKSSGKSTFAKLLLNRLISAQVESGDESPGIAFLDLDPGQPEFSPPGQLALTHLREPDFGPPFSHPKPGGRNEVVRSHSIGAVTPSLDPSLYLSCGLDLYSQYQQMLHVHPRCPLIINTPGWVLGTGLENLVELIVKVKPTEVIYMSQDGPLEVIQSLEAAEASSPVLILPSQASEFTTRTAAHLRTMQFMSYFHTRQDANDIFWNPLPLTSIPPWQVSYAGQSPGILGVICYGEQPPASLLAETINGGLVAVVVIDELAAIPGWETRDTGSDIDLAQSERSAERGPTFSNTKELGDDFFQGQKIHSPLLLRTPEGIPYFNPENAITLDPTHSQSIGLALVRGIDVARHRLQLLTPINPRIIENINKAGKSIVLVSGKLDTPGWAYTEELNLKLVQRGEARKEKSGPTKDDEDDDQDDLINEIEGEGSLGEGKKAGDGFKNAPWIERLEGSQGRGIGSRVWRVRRDLGKTGDGGE